MIKKLEAEGVGRPSTYATIIDNIVHRAYVSIFNKFEDIHHIENNYAIDLHTFMST